MSMRPAGSAAALAAAVLVLVVLLSAKPARADPGRFAAAPLTSTVRPAAPLTSTVRPDSLGGVLGGVASTVLSPVEAGAGALAGVGLSALSSWILSSAQSALQQTAGIISQVTAPHLQSAWFSRTYWRVAALGAMLTVPFLLAAAIQALLHADLPLLLRAVFGHLPAALLGVGLAAPLTMLLLAATDQMAAAVSAVGAGGGTRFLEQAAVSAGGLSAATDSPFLAVAVGLMIIAAGLALSLELLVREAAVYLVVLMLPLAFAAFVWPARRVWAVRMIELLIALILSKFVIVAVMSLAGAAYGASGPAGVSRLLTAGALVLLSVFAPWALMRILPFTEVAASAGGMLRAELPRSLATGGAPVQMAAQAVTEGPQALIARLAGIDRRGAGADRDPGHATPRLPPAAAHTSGAAAAHTSGAAAARETREEPMAAGPEGPSAGPGASGGGTSAGAPAPPSPPSSPGNARRQRIPGMEPMWQLDNESWEMTLGREGVEGPPPWEDALRPAPEDRPGPEDRPAPEDEERPS
jgi:hypothetical protein